MAIESFIEVVDSCLILLVSAPLTLFLEVGVRVAEGVAVEAETVARVAADVEITLDKAAEADEIDAELEAVVA